MGEVFEYPVKVLFQHCDPAGIVFYPRYFEMVNQTIEAWFEIAIGASFHDLHVRDRIGVPAAAIGADFRAPSKLGDALTFALSLSRLGRTSAEIVFTARCGDELRMEGTCTMVRMDLNTLRAVPWEEPMRSELGRFLEDAPEPPEQPAEH